MTRVLTCVAMLMSEVSEREFCPPATLSSLLVEGLEQLMQELNTSKQLLDYRQAKMRLRICIILKANPPGGFR